MRTAPSKTGSATLRTGRQRGLALQTRSGAEADEVALVRNTSEANNIINNGLDLKAGDEVVIWRQNHPTNNVAWKVRAQRRGFSLREVEVPSNPADPDELIRPFREALTPRTRVLALTHASNVSGVLLPVRELCEFARRSGIYVHVDGAQTWGALALDLHELGCDSFAASAHKWYCGPKEVGLLYVRRERIPEIWPSTVAPGWGEGAETELAGARKFESMGQRDDAAISAMREAAGFHSSIGTDRVEQRVRELSSLLKQSLAEAGAKLVTPLDDKLSAVGMHRAGRTGKATSSLRCHVRQVRYRRIDIRRLSPLSARIQHSRAYPEGRAGHRFASTPLGMSSGSREFVKSSRCRRFSSGIS